MLTLETGPTKASPTLTTDEEATTLASEYRELAVFLDEVTANLKIARARLLEATDTERESKIRQGDDVPSLKVPTTDGHRVHVVYAEKFKHLSISNAAELRRSFQEHYPLVCQEHEVVTVRKGCGLAAIETAIGAPALAQLLPLLTVKASVTPRKGAAALASRFFRDGARELGEDVLVFLRASMYSPQVRAK